MRKVCGNLKITERIQQEYQTIFSQLLCPACLSLFNVKNTVRNCASSPLFIRGYVSFGSVYTFAHTHKHTVLCRGIFALGIRLKVILSLEAISVASRPFSIRC